MSSTTEILNDLTECPSCTAKLSQSDSPQDGSIEHNNKHLHCKTCQCDLKQYVQQKQQAMQRKDDNENIALED